MEEVDEEVGSIDKEVEDIFTEVEEVFFDNIDKEVDEEHMVPEEDPGQKKNTIQVSYLSEIVSTSRFGICKF